VDFAHAAFVCAFLLGLFDNHHGLRLVFAGCGLQRMCHDNCDPEAADSATVRARQCPICVMNASANDQRGGSIDAARIENLVMQLPSQARVRVTMRNGDVFTGTVTERPATQLIRSGVADESINALVRLDDPTAPPWNVYLWLSDIERVETVGAQN